MAGGWLFDDAFLAVDMDEILLENEAPRKKAVTEVLTVFQWYELVHDLCKVGKIELGVTVDPYGRSLLLVVVRHLGHLCLRPVSQQDPDDPHGGAGETLLLTGPASQMATWLVSASPSRGAARLPLAQLRVRAGCRRRVYGLVHFDQSLLCSD